MTTQETEISKPVADISAIVVTYNRDAPLQVTLECLLKQNPAPREIIVVDQTKLHRETTQRFLKQLIQRNAIKYVFQSEPNAQKARNRAIAEASGSVLLFVDDDVEMNETLVGAHWKNYSDPHLAAVCGYYLEPGDNPVSQLPSHLRDPIEESILFPHSYTKRVECYVLPTCNGSVRREIALKLGGFDENYTHTLLDDTDLGCRLKKLGLRCIHDPEAQLIHLKEPSGGKRPGAMNEYVVADSNLWYIWCYFFWMNFGWRSWKTLARLLRTCVFRKKNMIRPWYLGIALWQFIQGCLRAIRAAKGGRKLGLAHLPPTGKVKTYSDSPGFDPA